MTTQLVVNLLNVNSNSVYINDEVHFIMNGRLLQREVENKDVSFVSFFREDVVVTFACTLDTH